MISLITGINGFVAGHLARYLLEMKEEVIGTHRWQEDGSRIKDIKEKIQMEFMDLNDEIRKLKVINIFRLIFRLRQYGFSLIFPMVPQV